MLSSFEYAEICIIVYGIIYFGTVRVVMDADSFEVNERFDTVFDGGWGVDWPSDTAEDCFPSSQNGPTMQQDGWWFETWYVLCIHHVTKSRRLVIRKETGSSMTLSFAVLTAVAYILATKALPGHSTFEACCRVSTSDKICRFVAFFLRSHVFNNCCIQARLSDGSLISMRWESRIIPRNDSDVEGPGSKGYPQFGK